MFIKKGFMRIRLHQREQGGNHVSKRKADECKSVEQCEYAMTSKKENLEWLRRCTEEYRSSRHDASYVVEDLEGEGKLGQGFTAVDQLEEVDIGDGTKPKPTYVSANLPKEQKEEVWSLVKEFADCFAWEYTEMSGLSRKLVEHHLPIKVGFKPYKQPVRNYNPVLYDRIKEEVSRLLAACFIRPCRYAEWVSNIVRLIKRIWERLVCLDFRNLNRATPKDEYPTPIVDALVNNASGNKVISFFGRQRRVQPNIHGRGRCCEDII
jgi:hypothetical protein